MVFRVIIFTIFIIFLLFLFLEILNISSPEFLKSFSIQPSSLISSIQSNFLFWSLLLINLLSFCLWGFSPFYSPSFVILLSLVLYLRTLFLSLSINPLSFFFVGENESLFEAFFFYFIHFLSGLMKSLSLFLRIFINLLFGHVMIFFLSFLVMNSVNWVFALFFFIIYELCVIMIQSFVFTFMLKMYVGDFFLC